MEYPSYTEELFYDKAGNRVRRVAAGEEEIYSCDSRNRLTERRGKGGIETYTYDEAGNLLRDGRAIYTYDAFNRTAKVETFSGEIQINRYDAEGLRAEIEENGRLVQFIYREREVVVEETAGEQMRYIRSDKLLASDAKHAKTWYHYASDELGSITHVEQAGEILNRYEYDAWGNPTTCEEKVENRFQFTGQQFDPVSQQYYLRARYYNPVIGRFTQEDTYYEDGLNLYAYCRNNPVYYVDPSGNLCKSGVERIANQIESRQATRDEYKILSSYIREKLYRNEALTDFERRTAEKYGIRSEGGTPSYGAYSTKIDFKVTVVEKQELPSWLIGTFKDGQYRTVVTNEEITVYREFGYNAEAGGAFATSNPAINRVQTKVDSAILPGWKNTLRYEAEIVIPKGTTLNIGRVGEQYTMSGARLAGDADQFLLPQNWDLNWIKNIRSIKP